MDSFKGRSWVLYSPMQSRRDTCIVVLDGYHLVVATSGFTQIGISGRGDKPWGDGRHELLGRVQGGSISPENGL
jgi:hypothetical protein